MDYEKAYKDALSRARQCLKDGTITQVAIDYIETIFPELAESKDERIRNGLIALLKFGLEDGSAIAPGFNETKEQAIAWLEKRGEKPQGKTALDAINEEIVDNANKAEPIKLAELEDEKIRKRIIHALHGDVLTMAETNKALAWLDEQGNNN